MKTRVRFKLPNLREWATAERVMKWVLIGQCVLAGMAIVLHVVVAVRKPEDRLTEISCATAWLCVVVWTRSVWHYRQMFFQVRDLLERRINGGDTFTSG